MCYVELQLNITLKWPLLKIRYRVIYWDKILCADLAELRT